LAIGGREWPVSQSVGEGVPKRGVGHTGHIVSAPFARENPTRPLGHRSPKVWGVGGGPGVASKWPVGRGGEASPSEGLSPIGRCR